MTRWTWKLKRQCAEAKNKDKLIDEIQRTLKYLSEAPRYVIEENITMKKEQPK